MPEKSGKKRAENASISPISGDCPHFLVNVHYLNLVNAH